MFTRWVPYIAVSIALHVAALGVLALAAIAAALIGRVAP